MGVRVTDPISQLSLPPGFRFYPTDEELLVQYLCRKIAGHHFSLQIIGDIDLYKFDPWDLPSKAIFGEKEWYFFSPRDRKYPNGSRPNRVAGSGYWKATGTDKIITTEGRKVGIKKALVFYIGKAPKGTKTNWIMHEYRLSDSPRKSGTIRLDDWVLCRIYKKNSSVLESLPDIDERLLSFPRMNSLLNFQEEDQKLNLQKLGSGNFDWAMLAALSSLPEPVQAQQTGHTQEIQMNGNNNYTNGQNDIYSSAVTQFGRSLDEEVQSGIRIQRLNNSGFFQQNPGTWSDPFPIRYPNQADGFGFSQ